MSDSSGYSPLTVVRSSTTWTMVALLGVAGLAAYVLTDRFVYEQDRVDDRVVVVGNSDSFATGAVTAAYTAVVADATSAANITAGLGNHTLVALNPADGTMETFQVSDLPTGGGSTDGVLRLVLVDLVSGNNVTIVATHNMSDGSASFALPASGGEPGECFCAQGMGMSHFGHPDKIVSSNGGVNPEVSAFADGETGDVVVSVTDSLMVRGSNQTEAGSTVRAFIPSNVGGEPPGIEFCTSNGNCTGWQGSQTGSAGVISMPSAAGVNGQVFISNGDGGTEWTDPHQVFIDGLNWYEGGNGQLLATDGEGDANLVNPITVVTSALATLGGSVGDVLKQAGEGTVEWGPAPAPTSSDVINLFSGFGAGKVLTGDGESASWETPAAPAVISDATTAVTTSFGNPCSGSMTYTFSKLGNKVIMTFAGDWTPSSGTVTLCATADTVHDFVSPYKPANGATAVIAAKCNNVYYTFALQIYYGYVFLFPTGTQYMAQCMYQIVQPHSIVFSVTAY